LGERIFLLESAASGVRLQLLSEHMPFYWIPTKYQYWDQKLEELAFSKLGQNYSKWEAVQSVWRKISPGKNNTWQCAEYVIWLLQQAGFKMNIHSTPSQLIWWLQSVQKLPVILVTDE